MDDGSISGTAGCGEPSSAIWSTAGETYLGVVPLGAVQPALPLVPHAAHILELTHSRPHLAVRAYFHAARRRCMVAARHEEEERSEEQHRRQVRSWPGRVEFEVGGEWLRRGEWLPRGAGRCGCVLERLGGHGVKSRLRQPGYRWMSS